MSLKVTKSHFARKKCAWLGHKMKSSDAKLVSTNDSMFAVAKISLIRSALGFLKDHFSKGKLESPKATNNEHVCNISNRKQSLEGERTFDGKWTNHRATNCISGRSTKFNEN